MHTTHCSIIDADGNRAAVALTVNTTPGSKSVAAGAGVPLNGEMDDFALVPNKPNGHGLPGSKAKVLRDGKRMLLSMSPSIVIGSERTAVIGPPGSATVIAQVLEGVLHFINGHSARQIVADGRFHHRYPPDLVMVVPGTFDPAGSAALTAMGWTLKPRAPWGA